MTWAAGAHDMHGWQWLSIIEGIPSVLAGIFAYFYMTDRPEEINGSPTRTVPSCASNSNDQKAQGERHSDWRTLFGNPMWLLIAVFFPPAVRQLHADLLDSHRDSRSGASPSPMQG